MHSIIISANDGLQSVDIKFTVEVLTNEPPVITSTPSNSAEEGKLYEYQVLVTDDGNYSLSTLTKPSWLVFDQQTALLSGIPSTTDIGAFTVTIQAIDELQTVVQTFTVTVKAKPAVNLPPPTPPAATSGGGGAFGLWLFLILVIELSFSLVFCKVIKK